MNKQKILELAKSFRRSLDKNSPEILTGLGIAGMITTVVLAVSVTPKAVKLVNDEIDRKNQEAAREAYDHDNDEYEAIEELKPLEVVKTTWKCYIPATVTCVVSVACLIGASSVNGKRNAALATAYSLSESSFRKYKEKVLETIGPKKEQEAEGKVAKDNLDKNPVSKTEVFITEKGNTLCYDSISGRYFKSDIEKIKKAINELNREMIDNMYVSLNDFYFELGLSCTNMGGELGWNVDRGLIDVNFSTQLADDGTPCLVLNYGLAPKYDYSRLC